MAMNRYGYLDFNKLELGERVSWEHPVTSKVYGFEVTELDPKDEYQPVELQLLDGLESGNAINVSIFAEFYGKGSKRWPYKTLAAHEDRNNQDADPNSITLDRLFYTSMHHVPKSAETEEIENGRILAHRALMEDLTTVEGDGSSEIALVAPEVRGELNIPSVDEVNQLRYTSRADFQKMFVEQLAEAIKEDEDHIKLPPVLVEMYREELVNLGYKVYYDAVYFEKFD